MLVCGLEEHTHSPDCMPDLTAGIETQEDWEATLPGELTGNVRERLVQIARSQLGYTQSDTNFHYADSGEKTFYSRYGEWYGTPTANGTRCLHTSVCTTRVWISRSFPTERAAWPGTADGIPEAGDVILLDSDMNGTADSCTIVSEVGERNNIPLLGTVQGNVRGSVAELGYLLTDGRITGYVSLKKSDGSFSFEQTSEEGITVLAEAESGTFPAGTTMSVTDIPKEDAVSFAETGIGEKKSR